MIENYVGIIIPSYNRFKSLQKCIKSVKDNTNNEQHIIYLTDDCSTEEKLQKWMLSIESEYKQAIENIDIVPPLAENGGFTKNVNNAIRYILNKKADLTPEFVMLLNNDAYIQNTQWLDKFMDIFRMYPNVGIVGTGLGVWCKDSVYPMLPVSKGNAEKFHPELQPLEARNLLKKQYPDLKIWFEEHIGFWGCMIRTELFRDYGLFDERFQVIWQDVDWTWRIAKYGWKTAIIDEDLIYHQGHTHCDLKPKAEIDRKTAEDHRLIREIWPEKWS